MGASVSVYYVGYDLQHGYIHNWLVAGPQAIPVQAVIASEAKQSSSRKEEIASSQKTLLLRNLTCKGSSGLGREGEAEFGGFACQLGDLTLTHLPFIFFPPHLLIGFAIL